MKNFRALAITAFLALNMAGVANAQPVARRTVAEHFTNTYCPICASRNPGLYQNLAQNSSVLHLAYYPSAPYPACPLSQYSSGPQDARATFYNVYGATPRLVIQGVELNPGIDYDSSTIFDLGADSVSDFELKASITKTGPSEGLARIVVTRKAIQSATDSLGLYAVLTQDTLLFSAQNGETQHLDVFRAALWGHNPVKQPMPQAVGDSLVFSTTFQIDAGWPLARIRATAMLQRTNRMVEQATRSGAMDTLAASAVGGPVSAAAIRLYPNPAGDVLHIVSPGAVTGEGLVIDALGSVVVRFAWPLAAGQINIKSLPAGNYLLSIPAGNGGRRVSPFVKQ